MANNLDLTAEKLDAYVDMSIDTICALGYVKAGEGNNHCAHFIGHALTLVGKANVGKTCAVMTWAGKSNPEKGVCILVDELFNRQTKLSEPDEKGCLIYITTEKNVTVKGDVTTMYQNPNKHVGIYLDGTVWHYGNTKHKVRSQPLDEFEHHYDSVKGEKVLLYTPFPKGAVFVPYTPVPVAKPAKKSKK